MRSVPAETDGCFWSLLIPAEPLEVFLLICQWISFLLWALDRQVTFVSLSLGLLAPDGGRVSFLFKARVQQPLSKSAGLFAHRLAVSWPVDLGNSWAGQREDISSSSFESLAFSLPLLFQENLLQDLSSSGCLTMRGQPMPCVLGWESLAVTLSTWVWGRSMACVCVCVYLSGVFDVACIFTLFWHFVDIIFKL